jgi:hypothetical protein
VGALVGAVAALACAAALVALPGAGVARAPTAGAGLLSLPVAAQGPISAALGGDRPAYRVRGLQAVNPTQHLRVRFTRRGVTVAAGAARLDMTLSAYGYASALRALGPVSPRASANSVSYTDGSLEEWFANGPLGLEQGFDVARRPLAGSGPLTLSLALSGNLVPRLAGSSLLLAGRGAALRYGGLLVTDARGRVLHSWLQLAGRHVLIRVDDRGAAYPLRVDPFLQQAELTAAGGATEEELGMSVGVSGDTIVVGAPNREVGGQKEEGEAYVFTRPSSGWANATQAAELTSENGKAGDRFGQAVAASGNTIVVGAPDHEVGAHNEQGAAYVFLKPASGWAGSPKQTAELTAKNGKADEFLGRSVAVSGNTVVAGAPGHEVGNHEHQGAAYVFLAAAGGWEAKMNQTAELTSEEGEKKEELGFSVAVSGNTVLAGAPNRKVVKERQGEAYVFLPAAGEWEKEMHQTAELTTSQGEENELFGYSLAAAGKTVVAGAIGRTVGANRETGAAFVFVMPGSGWAGSLQPTAELSASNGGGGDDFGNSVAASGNTVVVGAPLHTVGSTTKQGAAYEFVMPVSGWAGSLTQSAESTASNGAQEDNLGLAVAVSGDTVLAGAPGHKVGANKEQGAAYVFEEPPSVSIASPVNGASYGQGQVVAASYSCPTASGTSVTCSGPVANGATIETSTPGTHTFTVHATDSDALTASQTVSYSVVAAPITGPVARTLIAPILGSLSETSESWREGKALAHITRGKSNRKLPPIGTTFSFTVNEPASVTFTFTEPASGRKVGKRCVAQTKKNKHRRRCTRTVIAGTLTFDAHAGTNKVRFDGLISKNKKFKPGGYTLLVTAIASGKRSAPRMLHFTIVPPPEVSLAHSSALPHVAARGRNAQASDASAPICRGKARRLRPGHVSFSFGCGESADVTGFVLRANRAVHSVSDPSFAFGCERSTSTSFDCEDIHSGAGPEGSGVVLLSEPLCHPHARLLLRVTPTLNFEAQPLPTFALTGPC